MLWPGVLNQVIRDPRDVDDCWVFALQWAALAADPNARRYSKDEIRRAAGDPDDGVRDGGNLDEMARAAALLWPTLKPAPYLGLASGLLDRVRSGGRAAVALWAGRLPRGLQWGFTGAHAVGLVWDAALGWLIANPLAPEGSRPQQITEPELVAALTDTRLATNGRAWGVTFQPTEVAMAIVAYKEELWDAPAGLPFYDAPNGRQIGTLSKAATIRTFGAPLAGASEDWAWRAGLVASAQVTGSMRQLVVWFPRRQLTNGRLYEPPASDCSDEVRQSRAVALEQARTAAIAAVGKAIDEIAKGG